jgi:two-component system response regulator YesN
MGGAGMTSILVADDDYLALNVFYSIMDWERHGLRIVREARNGQDALSYLRDHPVGVAFLDVCMPGMDGLAALKAIRAGYPDTLCVMLSSYSEYPFVREALKAGAADYLLKHEISQASLLDLLAQHGVPLAEEPSANAREAAFLRLLSKEDRICVDVDISASDAFSGHLLCAFLTEHAESNDALTHARQGGVLLTSRHGLNGFPGALCVTPSQTEWAALVPFGEGGEGDAGDRARAMAVVENLRRALMKYHKLDYSFLPPAACADAQAIRSAYKSARQARAALPLLSGTHANTASQMDALTTVEETVGRILDAAALHGRHTPAVHKAIDVIHARYQESLRLQDLADVCHISPNHMGYLFKKETGLSLVAYLNRVRVLHAAHGMLFGGLGAADASIRAGFASYNHFVSTFRTVTGCTPSAFKHDPSSAQWLARFSRQMQES